ncbi:MAG: hypothetical protein M5U26_26180 [Planctomycetota bacterium]|nr:hypothetical protein [Planctomycetota bacterium]
MAASYCINHTDRKAAHRCFTCHKPLCDDCVHQEAEGEFCGSACRENYQKFHARYEPERSSGLFGWLFGGIKNLIVTVIGLGILGLILVYAGAKILGLGFCQNLLKTLGIP